MERDEQWATHTPMSDPGRYLSAISMLPRDLGLLIKIIQGLLVHADWAKEYGLDAARLNVSSRKTLSMVERLSDVVTRDARSLENLPSP